MENAMEDKKNAGGKKPLRSTMNKIKDLKDTYLKNNERNIPINDADEKNLTGEQNESDKVNENATNDQAAEFNGQDDAVQAFIELNKTLEKEKEELKDQLQRKAAEFENMRRRHLKEKQEAIDFGTKHLLFDMLELLDDITNAADHAKKSNDYDALVQGLDMIKNKAVKLFEDQKVTPMEDPTGKEFNVDFHEAMMIMPSELPENSVVQVFQKGYMMEDKVLRHARVATSSGPQE
eukprot:TRINITY_DN6986_c0_g1_i1.p2 TRINITY_DN6986_c0_g1~~TRINITY_DN6986_c0_g1_i1.p2  ORF type:complete len:235 (-),score=26.55 TRINITY_DN6986_c0_g1_i1:17-721(-)